jgi:hypothetical protein
MPLPGAAAAEEGRAEAASAAAPRAQGTRQVRVRRGMWVDRCVVTLVASAREQLLDVLLVRDFTLSVEAAFLDNETLIF